MTDWDEYYMNKPTKLDHLYPDPTGCMELEEFDRRVKLMSRILTAIVIVISVGLAVVTYPEWSWLLGK